MTKYIAFLRGINVSGRHKVPMAELKTLLEKLKCKNVITILNSGNVIFDSKNDNLKELENEVSNSLEKNFGFPIPTIIFTAESIRELFNNNPFKGIELTKDLKFYISFIFKNNELGIDLPWVSDDNSFKILRKQNNIIISILDISISKTTKAMGILEKNYGKNMTTRNWNTIIRIEKKIN